MFEGNTWLTKWESPNCELDVVWGTEWTMVEIGTYHNHGKLKMFLTGSHEARENELTKFLTRLKDDIDVFLEEGIAPHLRTGYHGKTEEA